MWKRFSSKMILGIAMSFSLLAVFTYVMILYFLIIHYNQPTLLSAMRHNYYLLINNVLGQERSFEVMLLGFNLLPLIYSVLTIIGLLVLKNESILHRAWFRYSLVSVPVVILLLNPYLCVFVPFVVFMM